MIQNKWKKRLAFAERSQNSVADEAGIDRGTFSRACSGSGILPYADMERVCDIIGCKPYNIYDDETMVAIYQTGKVKKSVAPTVCVRIKPEVAEAVDALVAEGLYLSRNEAVNALLRGVMA